MCRSRRRIISEGLLSQQLNSHHATQSESISGEGLMDLFLHVSEEARAPTVPCRSAKRMQF